MLVENDRLMYPGNQPEILAFRIAREYDACTNEVNKHVCIYIDIPSDMTLGINILHLYKLLYICYSLESNSV